MIPEITLLIHGPFCGSALKEISASFISWPLHTKAEVILVAYVHDLEDTQTALQALPMGPQCRVIAAKDLLNPGFFNINRQLVTVQTGLKAISPERFVIKLRNDQWVDFNRLQAELEQRGWLRESPEKLLTTNCFTRVDRLYHPSDMFLCAWQPALALYYSAPLMSQTHLDTEHEILRRIAGGEPLERAFICPEIYLFQNYLKAKGWQLAYTKQDSYNALKQYFCMVNSWEIDFRWKKARTPYRGEGAVILPQYWRWPPFAGMEDENIACYLRSDFEGQLTHNDKKYFKQSKRVWKRYEWSQRNHMGSDRAKEALKKAWQLFKGAVCIIALVLPHGFVIGFRRIWCGPRAAQIKNQIKQQIRKALR